MFQSRTKKNVCHVLWEPVGLLLKYIHIWTRVFQKRVYMNQRSRQNAKNPIEKDFYKLMNNSNFGYDCRNNLDNCRFVSIFDELQENTCLKRYYNYFDLKVSSFVSSGLIRQEIEENYNASLIKLSKDDKYYEIKLSTLNTKKVSHQKLLRVLT